MDKDMLEGHDPAKEEELDAEVKPAAVEPPAEPFGHEVVPEPPVTPAAPAGRQ